MKTEERERSRWPWRCSVLDTTLRFLFAAAALSAVVAHTRALSLTVTGALPGIPPPSGHNAHNPVIPRAPTLPQAMVDVTPPNTAGYTVVQVNAGGDLQGAINYASCNPKGTIIKLAASATFGTRDMGPPGGFFIPAKNCPAGQWIIVRSDAPDSVLPAVDVRITPAYQAYLPKILITSVNEQGSRTDFSANNYRLMFLSTGIKAGTFSDSSAAMILMDGAYAGGVQDTIAKQPATASMGTAPYTWSVTSGALPSGLAVVTSTGQISGTPSTAGAFGFIVQVKHSAAQSSSGSFKSSVASQPSLSIATASLPSGTVGASYAGTLQAAGGTQPYTWSVISGQLPSGLSLAASSGIVSGTPTGSGSFSFTVQVTDASSQFASLGLPVNIAAVPSGQAAPLTYTSRTDLNAAAETVPPLCSPAPCIMTSPDLNPNLKYTRVTDSNVTPFPGDFFATAGSAEQMEWNSDNTLFYVNNPIHGVNHFFKFNQTTQLTSKVTCSYVRTNCWNGLLTTISVRADGVMSGVSPYVFYGVSGSTIKKIDFSAVISSGGSSADVVTTVADARTCPGIPTTAGVNLLSMNDNDTRWLTAYGGGQDLWTTVFVHDSTQGCRWFNFSNWTVGGAWGPTGNATQVDELGNAVCSGGGCTPCSQIHNVRMDRDGRWARITSQCGSPIALVFWDIPTGRVYRLMTGGGVPPYFGHGHVKVGFDDISVNVDTDYTNHKWFTKRTIPPTGTFTWLTSGRASFADSHITWNNQTKGSLQPMIVSLYQTSAPTQAWGDEIIGVSIDGSGKVYRFAHQYTRAHDFNAQGIANVSRDGKWAVFTSDWMTMRNDVFLVPLK